MTMARVGLLEFTELHDLEKPVISAVNGYAVGGGFEIALSSDVIVAVEHAQFFLPEIKVGVVADAAFIPIAKENTESNRSRDVVDRT